MEEVEDSLAGFRNIYNLLESEKPSNGAIIVANMVPALVGSLAWEVMRAVPIAYCLSP